MMQQHAATDDSAAAMGQVLAAHLRDTFDACLKERQKLREQRNLVRHFLAAVVLMAGAAMMAKANAVVVVLAIAGLILAVVLYDKHRKIAAATPERTVARVGRVMLRFERLPFRAGEHVLLDRNGVIAPTTVGYPTVHDPGALRDAYAEWSALHTSYPTILRADVHADYRWRSADLERPSGEALTLYDVEARGAGYLARMSHELNRIDTASVRLPLIAGQPEMSGYLGTYGVVPAEPQLALPSAESRGAVAELVGTTAAGGREGGESIDGWLAMVREALAGSLVQLDAVRRESCDVVLRPYCDDVVQATQTGSFEYFCPECNDAYLNHLRARTFTGDESGHARPSINRSAVMRWVGSRKVWRCLLCEAEHTRPYTLPRLLVETFEPAYDRLMTEHHTERLDVYNAIGDEKRRFFNECEKELSLKREANRRDAMSVRARLRDTEAQIEGARAKLAEFERMLVQLQLVKAERLRVFSATAHDIAADVERAKRESEERFSRRVGEIESDMVRTVHHHAALAREEERQRDAVQQRMAQSMERTEAYAAQTMINTGISAEIDLRFAVRAGLYDE